MAGQGADRDLRPGISHVREILQAADVDQTLGARDAELERRNERVAAGEEFRIAVAEQLERVVDALGEVVVERRGDHCLASSIARQTLSGVVGIPMSVTPRCESASTTAFTTAGAAAIVPVSPTPLTPSGLVGLVVSVRPSSKLGTSAADGTR